MYEDLLEGHMRIFLICLAFAFAAMSSAQSISAQDTAVVVQQSSDTETQTELAAIYSSTTDMAAISVQIENGVATLTGDIPSADLAEKAVEIARKREGVVYVQDQLDRALVGENNVGSALSGLDKDIREITNALPLIGLAIFAFLFMWWLGSVVARRKTLWNKIATNPFLGEILSQTIRVLFIVGGLIIALNLLGAEALIATILGGAGVVGIALGFAVRDTLENYLASIMLSLRQPFRAGDHVLIGDREGKVVRLTSRATILMTMDGNHLRIPNSTVFKAIILNYTTNSDRRFNFQLGIDAADDPVAAMKTGLDVMRAHDFVKDDPAPSASISEVGDSNIVINFYGWIDQTTASFGKARSLSIRSVKDALEEEGFSLPEPIYRVKLDNMSGTKLDIATSQKSKSTPKRKPSELDLDTTPDTVIDEKVEAELDGAGQSNLLDESKPTE